MALGTGRLWGWRLALAVGLAGATAGAQALSLGQTENFSAGLAGWSNGANNPVPALVQPSGGPGGAGDAYLSFSALGGTSPGGRLVLIASDAWDGNYLGAGITGLRLALNNLGASDLLLRLQLSGPGGVVHSAEAFGLPSGSGWVSHTFSLAPAALSGIGVNATLAGVSEWRLMHAPVIAFPPDPVVAHLGVDQVTAVPEPASAALLLLGAGGLWLARRRPVTPASGERA